jgi:hypothetical protein
MESTIKHADVLYLATISSLHRRNAGTHKKTSMAPSPKHANRRKNITQAPQLRYCLLHPYTSSNLLQSLPIAARCGMGKIRADNDCEIAFLILMYFDFEQMMNREQCEKRK